MAESNGTHESLVVTTNRGDYYVIPAVALEPFRATADERARIDAAAGALAPGSYVQLRAAEASTRPSFASTDQTTLLAWLQDL